MNSASATVRSVLLGSVIALVACSSESSTTKPAPAASDSPASGTVVPLTVGEVPPNVDPAMPTDHVPIDPAAPAQPPPAPVSEDPKDHPGFKVETLAPGEGEELTAGKSAKLHYIGTLQNGKEFDSSWKRGVEPAEFSLDGVVPGFRMGLLGMKVGEHRRVTIPGKLGYGASGNQGAGIGPNATLIFDVELVDVVD